MCASSADELWDQIDREDLTSRPHMPLSARSSCQMPDRHWSPGTDAKVLMPRCGTVRRRGGQPVCQRILKFDPSGTYEGHFSRVGDTVLTVRVSVMAGAPAPAAWWCP